MRRESAAAGQSLLEQLLQHQQPDQRLGVLAAVERNIDLAERELDDLDPVLRRLLALHVVELGREEQPDALVREPGARVEALQLAPVAGRLPDLLGELALRALEW